MVRTATRRWTRANERRMQALILVPVVRGDDVAHLAAAWCAPRGPEVQKHRMAPESGQAEGVAGERLEGEIGCTGAGCLGRKHRSGCRQRRTRNRRRTRASPHIGPQEETPSFHFGSSAIVPGCVSKQGSF